MWQNAPSESEHRTKASARAKARTVKGLTFWSAMSPQATAPPTSRRRAPCRSPYAEPSGCASPW